MQKVRVALCQLNTTIGHFTHNVDKICAHLKQSAEQQAQIAVFPELSLSSYPPLDLLDRADFLEANQEALQKLQDKIQTLDACPEFVVIGSIYPNNTTVGRALQNIAIVLSKNGIEHIQAKRLLPTYDVFDEARYFEPASKSELWDSPFGKIGFSICEDAWFEDRRHGRQIYAHDPAESLRGAELVINLSASPFEMNKKNQREDMIANFVKRAGCPAIYVNQVGANDEILFDGGSAVYSTSGEMLYQLPHFQEGCAVVELSLSNNNVTPIFSSFPQTSSEDNKNQESSISLLHDGLVTGIRDYFQKTGFKKAVLGLSGGIDSAVVACLAVAALGKENVLGLSIPSIYSSTHSLTDAEALAKTVGFEHRTVSIKFIFKTVLMELKNIFFGSAEDITEENIQARMRGVMVMAVANKRQGLALTTGNKSELAVGYCTTYGDMAGALGPIGDVYKTKVYELARFINKQKSWIPENIIQKPPSAELRKDQKDEDSLGPYEQLDRLLEAHIERQLGARDLIEQGFDENYVAKILALVRHSEFKRRQAAPVLKTSSKAFGLGRRMPIAKSF